MVGVAFRLGPKNKTTNSKLENTKLNLREGSKPRTWQLGDELALRPTISVRSTSCKLRLRMDQTRPNPCEWSSITRTSASMESSWGLGRGGGSPNSPNLSPYKKPNLGLIWAPSSFPSLPSPHGRVSIPRVPTHGPHVLSGLHHVGLILDRMGNHDTLADKSHHSAGKQLGESVPLVIDKMRQTNGPS